MLEVEKKSWLKKYIYPVALSIGIFAGAVAGKIIGVSTFAMSIGAFGGAFAGLLAAMLSND